MSKQERIDILMELTQKVDRIIELLEVKKNIDSLITLDNKEVK